MAFQHGIRTKQIETSIKTPVTAGSGIAFVVGTSPIQAVNGKVNEPIMCNSYAEDAEEGSMALLNVISNLRYNFLKDEELNQQFRLVPPLESIIYPDDTRPYYLGEMMTIWTLPPVEREVNFNGY